MVRAFPMILVAVVLYNLTVFGGLAAGQHDMMAVLALKFAIPLFSGDTWIVTLGDLFLALTLTMLFVETVKATGTSKREMLNHALSMLTFTGALVEFIVLKGFGTSTFFFITVMCLFDVVAGYTISIVASRRGMAVEHHDYAD